MSTDFAPADPNQRAAGFSGSDDRSPLDRVFALGTTADRHRTLTMVLAAALLAHGGMAGAIHLRSERVTADSSLPSEQDEVTIEEREIPPPPRPPEPEPPPPPPPKVTVPVTAAAPPQESSEEPPASEAAQAGEVLVQQSEEEENDSEEEDDDDDNTFVTGHAESYAGGMTASTGSAAVAVHGSIVASGGVPGGSGTPVAAQKPPPGAKDLSREAWLEGNTSWDCDFPGEADRDRIDHAVVLMRVTVRSDGTAVTVEILDDPGHGFARMASACALKHRFAPALNREGKPIWGTTRKFHVGFHR